MNFSVLSGFNTPRQSLPFINTCLVLSNRRSGSIRTGSVNMHNKPGILNVSSAVQNLENKSEFKKVCESYKIDVRFEVLTAEIITLSSVVTSCKLVSRYRRFG
jgi:hypothetical protein